MIKEIIMIYIFKLFSIIVNCHFNETMFKFWKIIILLNNIYIHN